MCNCSNGKSLSTKLLKDAESITRLLGRYNENHISIEQINCGCCGESELKLFDVVTRKELRR